MGKMSTVSSKNISSTATALITGTSITSTAQTTLKPSPTTEETTQPPRITTPTFTTIKTTPTTTTIKTTTTTTTTMTTTKRTTLPTLASTADEFYVPELQKEECTNHQVYLNGGGWLELSRKV